jgi:two-component system chemotaxis response regulator CheY
MTLARILTVDDSASIRLTINVTLSNAGYSVVEASDGAEGLAAAQQDAFDLIITDLNMPGMDGLQMIEAIRKQPIGAGVPIIFLSTESDGDVKAQAKAAGATGWLTKPFDPETLIKIVRKVIGR